MLELAPLFDVIRNSCILARKIEQATRKFKPIHHADGILVQWHRLDLLRLTSRSILRYRLLSYLRLPINSIYHVVDRLRDIPIRFWSRLRFTPFTAHWSHGGTWSTCLSCSFFGLLTLLFLLELCNESSPLWWRQTGYIVLELLL